jgi:hypothetical protein
MERAGIDLYWLPLGLVPKMPMLVWGRDEARTGEMWNSNSMISWLIARTGLDVDSIEPPAGGWAPGWNAGVVVEGRESASLASGLYTNGLRDQELGAVRS